jgi:TRAP-type mannitol/chloroaromatic compound transport system permease small subunit
MKLANKVGQTAVWLIEHASHIFWAISGTLIVLMVFASAYGVIRRYAFNNPEPYSYEVSIIFLLWCFVFAVPELEKRSRHIRVDIITSHLPRIMQGIFLNIIGPVIGLFVCILLAWRGWTTAWYSLRIGEVSSSVWAVPLFPVKIIIPVCYGLLCLVLLIKLYRGVASLRGGIEKPTV